MDDGESNFLTVAIEHGLLLESHAAKVREYAQQHNARPSDAALTLSVLQANEVEAIKLLCNPRDLAPGYELTGLIGCGAGGMVFRACQSALNRDVALKTINPQSRSAQATGEPRIQREAHAIAKLRHPGIVAAFDSGFFQGRFCIAMELVDGQNLVDYIQLQSVIPESVAWHIARQIAFALSHASDFGIVHRDIKPANLLLCDPPKGTELPKGVPFVKVADFGLAIDDESVNQITATGATLGTPAYVAPEQLQDPNVDLRADIYALGATVFHMLGGCPPCVGQSTMKTIMQKTIGDDRWRDEISPTVTPGSVALFRDMTEADPEQRIPDYETLIQRIDELLPTLDSAVADVNPVAPTKAKTTPSAANGPGADTSHDSGQGTVATVETVEMTPDEIRTFAQQDNVQNPTQSWARTVIVGLSTFAVLGLLAIAFHYSRDKQSPTKNEPVDVQGLLSKLVPDGFPQPLFNGSSVPLFRQAGVWLPISSADGSRVLGGEEGSWMTIPLSIDDKPNPSLRLRIGINMTEGGEAGIEIVSSSAESNSKPAVPATLNLANAIAAFTSDSDVANPSSKPFSSSVDNTAFQNLAFVCHGTTIQVLLNGESVGQVQREPLSTYAITLRCIKDRTNFADIDIVALK